LLRLFYHYLPLLPNNTRVPNETTAAVSSITSISLLSIITCPAFAIKHTFLHFLHPSLFMSASAEEIHLAFLTRTRHFPALPLLPNTHSLFIALHFPCISFSCERRRYPAGIPDTNAALHTLTLYSLHHSLFISAICDRRRDPAEIPDTDAALLTATRFWAVTDANANGNGKGNGNGNDNNNTNLNDNGNGNNNSSGNGDIVDRASLHRHRRGRRTLRHLLLSR
jgi:hypothetical protein